jgi:hypothetical protein
MDVTSIMKWKINCSSLSFTAVNSILLRSKYSYVSWYIATVEESTEFYVLLTVYLDILCDENQLDTLLIFHLFRQSNSPCFGHVYFPSSGVIHCILYVQQLVGVVRLS